MRPEDRLYVAAPADTSDVGLDRASEGVHQCGVSRSERRSGVYRRVSRCGRICAVWLPGWLPTQARSLSVWEAGEPTTQVVFQAQTRPFGAPVWWLFWRVGARGGAEQFIKMTWIRPFFMTATRSPMVIARPGRG